MKRCQNKIPNVTMYNNRLPSGELLLNDRQASNSQVGGGGVSVGGGGGGLSCGWGREG